MQSEMGCKISTPEVGWVVFSPVEATSGKRKGDKRLRGADDWFWWQSYSKEEVEVVSTRRRGSFCCS